jgi:hypothetical protein
MSVWVILLDHSGSMGQSFKAPADDLTLRDRTSRASAKLHAAIECVLVDLERLPSDMLVGLFGFTNSAALLASGRAGDRAVFVHALEQLRAGGGTDIAGALDCVRDYCQGISPRPLVIRILLVTDGLSDEKTAVQAALECAATGLTIDVVLIDPTPKARELAAAVAGATGGRWEPVFGTRDLRHATAEARDAVAAQVQRTEDAVSRVTSEADAIRAETAGREAVLFAANYPGTIAPKMSHPIYVHVYSERLLPELEAKLAEFAERFGTHVLRADAPTNSVIEPGTALEIQPIIQDVRCRPSKVTVEWRRELESALFEVEYVGPEARDSACSGTVLVTIDNMPVAQIPISFSVLSNVSDITSEFRTVSARMIQDVFGSYAHEDTDVVVRFRAAYRALGIRLFIDTLDIDGGQPWRHYLRQQIERSDLFQLFWSGASSASTAVEDEWQHALTVAATRPSGTIFIRPVFWSQPLPPPPKALADLHFRYVDPQSLGLSAAHIAAADRDQATTPPASRADVRFPVLPLVDEWDDLTVEHIQDAMRLIVPFIEGVTGLRYYPPVTYLTDEITVIELRKATESDARWLAENNTSIRESLNPIQERAVRDLNSLLLQFGTHSYRHSDAWGRDIADARHEAEGGFIADVRDYLQGRSPRSRLSRDEWRIYARAKDFPAYAETYFNLLLGFLEHQTHISRTRHLPEDQMLELRREHGSAVARSMERIVGRRVIEPGPADEAYLGRLNRASLVVLRLIKKRPEPPVISSLLRVAAPTFGVFQYSGTAPPSAHLGTGRAPSNAPAVLICRNAIGRILRELREESLPEDEARQRARSFLTSTLVHEHAHAALATGLDSQGLAAAAADTAAWTNGHNLNEAFAAWTQRHYNRDNPIIFEECSRYIATGRYPSWPYAGADALERLYGIDGLKSIRQYIYMLRQTPEIAQRQFDDII